MTFLSSSEFQGFQKLHYFTTMALAVSKTGKLEVLKVYEAPVGWHWGSKAEVAAIMGWVSGKEYYSNQGGWLGNTWEGVERHCFIFNDSLQVGGCLRADQNEGEIDEQLAAEEMAEKLSAGCFAGIVCVAN